MQLRLHLPYLMKLSLKNVYFSLNPLRKQSLRHNHFLKSCDLFLNNVCSFVICNIYFCGSFQIILKISINFERFHEFRKIFLPGEVPFVYCSITALEENISCLKWDFQSVLPSPTSHISVVHPVPHPCPPVYKFMKTRYVKPDLFLGRQPHVTPRYTQSRLVPCFFIGLFTHWFLYLYSFTQLFNEHLQNICIKYFTKFNKRKRIYLFYHCPRESHSLVQLTGKQFSFRLHQI